MRSIPILLWLAVLLALGPTLDVAAQSERGRTSGRSDAPATTDTRDRSARSTSSTSQKRAQQDQTPAQTAEPASRSRADSRASDDRSRSAEGTRSSRTTSPASSPRATDSDRARTAASRDDRQSGTEPRTSRPAPRATTPVDRTVSRDVPASTRTPAATSGPRRDAVRAARGGRLVTPVPVRVVRPVHVHVVWPWPHRHQQHWSPRYRYRQHVVIQAGWLGNRSNAAIEVETTYRHRLRRADNRRAEIDIDIERIALFDRGRFIGEIDRIPSNLSRTRAYVYRNGAVRFDREVFVVGSRIDGFELISTRYYDDYILDAYDPRHGYRAGYLDFRRNRVVHVRHSRFFDPYHFAGYVPISLLPDDSHWLLDYGRRSISGYYYESRGPATYGSYGTLQEYHEPIVGESRFAAPGEETLERAYRREIQTAGGAVIDLKRDETLQRVLE